ncbi:MAG: RNA methyltransferase [Myxococcales bacterium]|nr:RNA methyltransferase [Myxococcales bacterium]MDH3482612.1 RNA methyltransferase [Myxococcales bacterium]
MRADDPDVIEIEGPPPLSHPAEVVIQALSPVVTPERRRRIEQVVSQRTDDLVVVLDSISDPHNASAVLRSADAFGVQTVHVIVGSYGFRASRGVSKGTHRWIDLIRYETAEACAKRLRDAGYAIYVAATGGDHHAEALRTQTRLAVVFGNEHRGASPEWAELADGTFSIPMRGFVESLNVSVAAAVTMQTLAAGTRAPLSHARRRALEARFLMNSVKNADEIINEYVGND